MKRRQGMFGNAKISEKVFKNLPSNVARGVQKDIQYVLKKDNSQDVRKWNQALPTQDDFDQQPSTSNANFATSKRKAPRKSVPSSSSSNTEFMTAKQLLAQRHHSNVDESVTPQRRSMANRTLHDETPTVFKSPPRRPSQNLEEDVFPSNPDPDEIASRILVGLPHLPLRNNDATTYSEAVTGILQSALSHWFDDQHDDISIGSTRRRENNESTDPNRSFMDKTAPLNLSRCSGLTSEASESPFNTLEFSKMGHESEGYTQEAATIIREEFEGLEPSSTIRTPDISRSFYSPSPDNNFQLLFGFQNTVDDVSEDDDTAFFRF